MSAHPKRLFSDERNQPSVVSYQEKKDILTADYNSRPMAWSR
jgi:hypothetical protein